MPGAGRARTIPEGQCAVETLAGHAANCAAVIYNAHQLVKKSRRADSGEHPPIPFEVGLQEGLVDRKLVIAGSESRGTFR